MAVAKKEEIVVAQAGPPVVDFGADAGSGFENMRRDEYTIPFLRILQPLSPQCKPANQGGLAGARAGMLFNSATHELYDAVDFVPCHRDYNFVEYVPRDAGGGFVGSYEPNDPVVVELQRTQPAFGKLHTKAGNEVTETFYLYGLILPAGGSPSRAVISFTSTQIKKYKNFMTRTSAIKYQNAAGQWNGAPLWAHRWRLATVGEQNKKGSFFGWSITLAAKKEDGSEEPSYKSLILPGDALYQAGADFAAVLRSGEAKADFSAVAAGEVDSGGAVVTDEVPF